MSGARPPRYASDRPDAEYRADDEKNRGPDPKLVPPWADETPRPNLLPEREPARKALRRVRDTATSKLVVLLVRRKHARAAVVATR